MRVTIAMCVCLLAGCAGPGPRGTGSDTGTDTGTDTGADTGTDTGADTGTDTGADTDAGTDIAAVADSQAGTDADAGTGTTDTGVIEDTGEPGDSKAPLPDLPAPEIAEEVVEADTDTEPKELVIPEGLSGKTKEGFPPPPEFSAVVNTKNETVDASALLGHWTVMWFYPAASTFG